MTGKCVKTVGCRNAWGNLNCADSGFLGSGPKEIEVLDLEAPFNSLSTGPD